MRLARISCSVFVAGLASRGDFQAQPYPAVCVNDVAMQ